MKRLHVLCLYSSLVNKYINQRIYMFVNDITMLVDQNHVMPFDNLICKINTNNGNIMLGNIGLQEGQEKQPNGNTLDPNIVS